MSSLPAPLRRQLERTICDARKIAEAGAAKALCALAVHEPDPYRHMDKAQRAHRKKLQAQAKQLGDGESRTQPGAYEIRHLVEKLAYDQWHRILFARYLLENDLLISPEHGVSVSLEDCEELAPSLGLKDSWTVAARFAAKELPEIFRDDDPAGAVELPVEDRNPLLQLVTGLPMEVFTASDSLGWCYQFWQAERKDQVNAAGNKIGADELPSVTQLFTEDYMVDFLLDNTLGAWHAGKVFAANPKLAENAQSEDELRQAVALPGCPWKYLRFIKGKDGKWTPAAGTFDGWPKSAAALRALDPCMGSGHFVVAMFERLVALRLAEEKLDEAAAVAAVIRDNLFGLEIDPRCTQIAAFNLALAAWRRVGHCKLPAMNLACSGLAPNTSKDSWVNLAALLTDDSPLAGERDLLGPRGEPMLLDARLAAGMARLYDLFQKAPVLGSLINPRSGEADLLVAAFHELQPLLEKALAAENSKLKTENFDEMAVTARGLAKAAEILAGQFTLVATNVPYLGRNKHDDYLKDYCERVYPNSKTDLATCFVERSLSFCSNGGSTALVTLQNWLFYDGFQKLRNEILNREQWDFIARLGPKGFRTPMWDFNVMLLGLTHEAPVASHEFFGLDVSEDETPDEKDCGLLTKQPLTASQKSQLQNPDARIGLETATAKTLLGKYADLGKGSVTGDGPHYLRKFWEILQAATDWRPWLNTPKEGDGFSGRESFVFWKNEGEDVRRELGAWLRGDNVFGRTGILINKTTLGWASYAGEMFDDNTGAIIPLDRRDLTAVLAFITDTAFASSVKKVDQSLKVTIGSFGKIPFDLAHWQKVAAEKYPHGLPKPFSSDPTQWLFNGHPAGADQPLHVAIARLLGYQWPRQTGSSFPDCPALSSDGLETFADTDGIVCLSATKGEPPAAERLRTLLAQALGTFDLRQLLTTAGPKGSKSETLDEWLRDEFFDQHCALFHHRPFLWHIWDGLKNGFSALVNYHKLTHANLEKLTFAYLGDWIRRQQAAVEAEEAGSDAKLQAAKQLQATLKLILEGEPPYDIFVRWKPLSQQAIGWHPDLNDGVRMNIRPFLATDIPGGKRGAGLLRAKPNIKWEKDRGKEPQRPKEDYLWFWQGNTFTGDRLNDIHLTQEQKEKARK